MTDMISLLLSFIFVGMDVLLCSAAAGGNNGVIQILDVGEYCTNFHHRSTSNWYGASGPIPTCFFCRGQSNQKCL